MANSILSIAPETMARIQQAAENEEMSPEELIQNWVEEYLARKRRQELYARAKRRTAELGIPESQVDAIVREERDKAMRGQ